MRRQHHIHPDELMRADLLSEVLLLGTLLIIIGSLLLVLVHS